MAAQPEAGAHHYIYCDVVTHMKTTIDISTPLLEAAKKAAAREGTTVKALVERGLRQVLSGEPQKTRYRLRKASFKGRGLQEGVRNASWERLRELACEDRGA